MARRPKPAKLAANAALREYVANRLTGVIRQVDGGAHHPLYDAAVSGADGGLRCIAPVKNGPALGGYGAHAMKEPRRWWSSRGIPSPGAAAHHTDFSVLSSVHPVPM
jgi:hypothetical protein